MSDKLKLSLLLAAIMALGFALRIYKITDKGFFHYDEAYFMLETKAITEGLKEMKGSLKTGLDLGAIKGRLIDQGCIFPPATARPSYNLLLVIPALITGMKDYCVFLPSVFFSTLAVWLCFLLARKYWDTRTGITAAFLVATSAFNILYSRSGYAQTTAGVFLLLALYLYLKTLSKDAGPREAVIAGLALGFAVTCHYGVLFSMLVLFGTEILLLLLRSHKRTVKTFSLLLLSFGAPIALYEVLYRLVKTGLGASISEMNFMTYFQQFIYVSANAPRDLSPKALLANDYLFYPRELMGHDGYLAGALLLATGLYFLVRVIKKREPAEVVLYLQSYAMLAFWILNPGEVKGGRILMLFHPLLLLFAAKLLTDAFSAIKTSENNRSVLLASFLVLFLALNAGTTLAVINTRSLFRDMADRLKGGGVTDVAVFTNWPIWQFHFGHKIWANLDRIKNEGELAGYCKTKKIDYLVLDYRVPLQSNPARGSDYSFLNRIAAEKPPEFAVGVDTFRENLAFYGNFFTPVKLFETGNPPYLDKIKIYRISKLWLAAGKEPPGQRAKR
ncbi:MAG TPA: hypothetical protein DCZ92_13895 [Elusimicrobia bacterium]|nr:MAG: hypothetical protein A2016_05530 [Elusimicrobia bacterium GWF2_62_30]HBA61875.1 hypothetical protein [Elusimicrobiota bacterium]